LINRISRVVKHFDRRSAVYDAKGTWVSNSEVLSAMHALLAAGLVDGSSRGIDLGSGTGAVSKFLLDQGVLASIVALDLSQEMLSQMDDPRPRVVVGSVEQIPCPSSVFDWAVSRQCLHYVENVARAVDEIRRVLKMNGIFVLAQIVPFDENEKDEWREIVSLRQPLAPSLLSEDEWVSIMEQGGLSCIQRVRVSHRSSTSRLAAKHRKENDPALLLYMDAMARVSPAFARNHGFVMQGEDISYDAFWSILLFRKT